MPRRRPVSSDDGVDLRAGCRRAVAAWRPAIVLLLLLVAAASIALGGYALLCGDSPWQVPMAIHAANPSSRSAIPWIYRSRGAVHQRAVSAAAFPARLTSAPWPMRSASSPRDFLVFSDHYSAYVSTGSRPVAIIAAVVSTSFTHGYLGTYWGGPLVEPRCWFEAACAVLRLHGLGSRDRAAARCRRRCGWARRLCSIRSRASMPSEFAWSTESVVPHAGMAILPAGRIGRRRPDRRLCLFPQWREARAAFPGTARAARHRRYRGRTPSSRRKSRRRNSGDRDSGPAGRAGHAVSPPDRHLLPVCRGRGAGRRGALPADRRGRLRAPFPLLSREGILCLVAVSDRTGRDDP